MIAQGHPYVRSVCNSVVLSKPHVQLTVKKVIQVGFGYCK